MISRKISKYFVLTTTIFFINTVNAQTSQTTVDQASIASKACEDKGEGDVCDFVNNAGNSVNGSCKLGPNGKLNCVPLSE